MNRSAYRILGASLLLATAGSASAAQFIDLHQANVAQVAQKNATLARANVGGMVHSRHARALGFDRQSRLLMVDRDSSLGVRTYRYQQTFQGLPVFGEHVVVSEDAGGNVRALFGRSVAGLASEISAAAPRVNKARAFSIARSAGLGLRQGFMQISDAKTELMIHIDDFGTARKAYVVSYFADTVEGGSPTRPFVVVDANNGRVITQWENLQHALVGTGPGGNQETGQ